MAQKRRTHKKLPKRKNQKKQSFLNKHFTTVFAIALAFFIGIGVGIYLFLGTDQLAIDTKKEQVQKTQESKKELSYEEKTKALEIEYADNGFIEVPKEIKKEEPTFHYEEPDYGKVDEIVKEAEEKVQEKAKEIIPAVKEKLEKVISSENLFAKKPKPKLVIIIDDVTTNYQIKKIKEIGYPVNMAFLPPTSNHPRSAKIAGSVDRYMIHLPLQASSSRYEEEGTLYIYDSIERIENKIKSIKELYPHASFINNHTGSKFTADFEAMDKLLQVLKKYDYSFVDSRTTAHSVARKAAKKHDVKFFSRNIFLDNKKDKVYIQNQLKKAIKRAKKDGKAIAIGHPFNITFNTLKDSKELLKDLDLVYIEQL